MWLFTRYGFFSIACARKPDGSLDPDTVMVRARRIAHLKSLRKQFRDTPHTRGFYDRAAVLYHHARGTPPKRLFWMPLRDGRVVG